MKHTVVNTFWQIITFKHKYPQKHMHHYTHSHKGANKTLQKQNRNYQNKKELTSQNYYLLSINLHRTQ